MWISMHIAYLGKRWYQEALWEKGQLAEAVWCFKHCLTGKPAIHVDITETETAYLNIAEVLSFMEIVFPDDSGLF